MSVDIGSVGVVVVVARPVAAGEKIDLVGEDLGAVAGDPVLVLPLGVVDAALDADQLALGAVLADGLGEAVEAGHPVELAFLGGVAVLVLVGLTVLVPQRAIGDDGDPGNAGAALGRTGFRIACSRRIRTTVSTTNIPITPPGKAGSLLHHQN